MPHRAAGYRPEDNQQPAQRMHECACMLPAHGEHAPTVANPKGFKINARKQVGRALSATAFSLGQTLAAAYLSDNPAVS